ncbi:unnamed protein product [Adineta ricciae]|uniref:Spermidine synthase n=1 Tax=Adineta ricciae TaxID=249248 RepID=A0A815Q3J4_ADIRI|nr:unnamed protein product [Adineta ricciae]CAF1457757.1 unnamed protein product [Adineta ricciae]
MRFHSLSNGCQAQIDLKSLDYPCVNYIQLMILSLIYYPLNFHKEINILIIGLGGGILPKALRKLLPNSNITIVEIDPLVYKIAQKYFYFQIDSKMKISLIDGRKFLEDLPDGFVYDLIFFDAYDSNSGLPSHMKTQEFFQLVQKSLNSKGGLFIFNLVCIYRSYFLVKQTILSVFRQNAFLTYRSNDFVNIVGIISSINERILERNANSKIIKDIQEKLSIDVHSLLTHQQQIEKTFSNQIYKDSMNIQQNEQQMSFTQFINTV